MGFAPARAFFAQAIIFSGIFFLTNFVNAVQLPSGSQALGAAQDFNAFVLEDFTFLSSTVEGRLAVGGNLSLQNFSVGDKLDSSHLHDVVYVAGNVTFPSGRIYYGNLLAGGSVAGVGNAVLHGMAAGASVQGNQTLPINFSAEHDYLKTLSQNIANLPANGNVTLQWGGFYLAGDCSSDLQVFAIDANQLKSVHTFAVSCIPAGATVIFNIIGNNSTIQNVGFQSLTAIRNKVLFNFPQATNIKLTSVGIEGSILAPLAHFENPAGNISGQLIAKSWRSTNYGYMSITNHKFTGDLSAVLTNPVNSIPDITSNPILEVTAGDVYQYQVTAIDADAEDVLIYTLPSGPSGMVIDEATGVILWNTLSSQVGIRIIEVRVTDSKGDFDTQIFELNVIERENRVPEFISSPIIVGQENQPYTYQVQAVDPDEDALTYLLVTAPASMSINSDSGQISWEPLPGDAGTHNIKIQVQDDEGGSVEQTFTLTIAPRPNQMPQITTTPITQIAAHDVYQFTVQATDPDQGDTITFALIAGPADMTITADTGEVNWSPTAAHVGDHPIIISASDNRGLSNTLEFTLTVYKANSAPIITSQPNAFTIIGDVWQYTLEAEDPDGDALTFALEQSPDGAVFDEASNTVSWPTSGAGLGDYTFRFSVTDSGGLAVEQSTSVEVLSTERRSTHEGTEFWIPVSINYISGSSGGTFDINLVSKGRDTQATLAIPALGVNENLSLVANEMLTYSISLNEFAATEGFTLNELIEGHAIHITSASPISAYFMNQKNSSTDGFLGLPTASLGKEYIAATYTMLGRLGILKTVDGGQLGPIITVIATEDNTEVIIDPIMDILPGDQRQIEVGTPIVVSMNRGDVYHLQTKGSFKADLTGSMIKANKPVGVFGQMESVHIPVGNTASDHIIEQLPPIESLATEYYTVPFWGRTKSGRFWYQEYGDTFRAVAPYDDTEIYINQTLRARLNKGEYFEFIGKEPQQITSSHPVLIVQYSNSNQFDDGYRELESDYTDPFMVIVPPAAQFLNSYTINTPARDLAYNFANLLVPTNTISSLTVDGQGVDESLFKPIPNSEFSYIQLPLSSGSHHLAAEEPFGIYVYGYDYFESYGYLGGMALSAGDSVTSISLTGATTQSLDNQWCAELLAIDEYERPVHGARIKFLVSGVSNSKAYHFTNARGTAQYCYTANKPGADIVTANLNDLNQSINVSWSGGAENLPPVINSLPQLNVVNGTSYSYNVLAEDPEGDALTYSLVEAPTGMTINRSGHLLWPEINLRGTKYNREKVVVRVVDANGHESIQQFELNEYIPFNTLPTFEPSVMSPTGMVGVPYVYNTKHLQHSLDYLKYQVLVKDVDEDAVFVDILSGPPEAYIQRIIAYYTGITRENDPRSCEGCIHYLRWVPQEVGEHSFELGLRDARGGTSESRNFTVNVAPNLAPEIVNFNPPTVAAAGYLYSYVLDVENDLPPQKFDNLDNLRIIFEQVPFLMRSDLVRSGNTQKLRISWAPASSHVGVHTVRLRVADRVNVSAAVEFSIEVINNNKPPIITSGTMPNGEVSIPYEHQVKAIDPNGDAVTFHLVAAPAGMTIDQTSGIIRWNPTADYAGEQASLRYVVKDQKGLLTEKVEAIFINAFNNRAPQLVPAYRPKFAKIGTEFTHQIQAVDREGDIPITYSLSSNLTGPKINSQSGIIRWTPTTVGRFLLTAKATDSLGNYSSSNSESWYVQVVPATELLDGEIRIAPSGAAELGSPVNLSILTTNEATSPQVTLTVDGEPVAVNPLLKATVTPTRAGRIPVTAIISDGHETITRTTTIVVRDPADITPPIVEFNSPANNADITAPTDIQVTVQDEGLTNVLLAYKAADKPAGEVVNLEEFTVLYEGSDAFDNETIAQLDTTQLMNGLYHVFLQATDANNNTKARLLSLNVTGDLKVGNFSFTVEDLSIPVGGFPITVARTYDGRRKTENLDVGYGWSLDYQAIRVQESIEPTRGWFQDRSNTQVYQGTTGLFTARGMCAYPVVQQRVTITLPNGDTESFAAAIRPTTGSPASLNDPDCYLAADRHYNLFFRPINGTRSTLETSDGESLYLADSDNGNLGQIDDSTPVNIRNYTLTTRNGYVYRLNQDFGLKQIEDPNGNTLTYNENGIVHSNGETVVFKRDAQGRINEVVDPAGRSLIYGYSGAGDLVSVTDRDASQTTYSYNTSHGLLDIIDPLGRKLVKNLYDDNGRLIAQEDSNGNRTDFSHDLEGRQSMVTDRRGNVTLFYYDERGNVLNTVDALGNQTGFTYDERDNQLTETDPLGFTQTATFNDKDDQLTATDAMGNTVAYVYNDRGQETTITDARGNSFTNAYDGAGNLLSINDPLGNSASNVVNGLGLVTQTTDLLGRITSYTYDATGNKLTETDAAGHTTTFTYDANHNVLTETRTRTVAQGVTATETTTYEYDSRDRLIATVNALGQRTETEYDLAGQEVASIDALGRRTEMDYDAYGRLIATRYPDGTTDSKGYDAEGNLLTETDRAGRITRHEYDALNRLIRTTYSDNTTTETDYDAAGRVIAQTDALGNRTTYTYDAAGRRTSSTDALGNTHDFSYDEAGNLVGEIDALGRVTSYTYNALDQQVGTGFHDLSNTSITLDAMGNKTASTDQAGVTTTYVYDALNRLIRVTDIAGNTTAFSYDEAGNKLTQTDAEGRTTRWEYDALGRQTTRILPMGQRETFVYDAAGNLASHTDFNGATTINTYDPDNDRLLSIDYADGSRDSFTYDVQGNRTSATQTDAAGVIRTTTYRYDSHDRLLEETQPDGHRLNYAYDANGNRTQVTVTQPDNSQLVTDYGFDALNRLSTVTDTSGTTTYLYDAVGNRTRVTYPNGTSQRYHYDSLNRLTTLDTYSALNTLLLQRFDYTLHPTGRRTQIEELNGRTTSYVYDNLYRLTEEQITDSANGNYNAEYTYDKVGNRTYETIDGVSTAYSYDANDRLTQTGGKTFVYDSNGNTLSETIDGITTTYVYNNQNQLVETIRDGVTTTYRYNPEGIRVGQGGDTQETTYVVDQNRDYAQVLLETNTADSNTETVHYTYGDDLISQNRSGNTSYYHYDGLGSTRALSNATGTLTDTYAYEAFGTLLHQTGDTENNYLFTGEQYDPNLNQYYLRARYYDQSIGRFTQQDTWMGNNYDPITLHKYLYANIDPGNMIDPSGNFSIGSMMSAVNTMATLTTRAQMAINVFNIATGEQEVSAKQMGTAILFNMLGNKAGKLMGLFGSKLKKQCVKNSFTGDTLVSAFSGLKLISEIEIGDLVWSYNETTGESSFQEVVHLIQGQGNYDLVEFELENGNLTATDGHPFYIPALNDWIDAREISVESLFLSKNNLLLPIKNISKLTIYQKVYNLTVANTHNYYVGHDTVLVHNGTCDLSKVKVDGVFPFYPKPSRAHIEINQKHVPGKKGFNAKAGTLPDDWDIAFERYAVFDGKAWYANGQNGSIYRYFKTGDKWHWSGSTRDLKAPLTRNDIPSGVLKHLGAVDKGPI